MGERYKIIQVDTTFWGRPIYGILDNYKRVFTGSRKECDYWANVNILLPALDKLINVRDERKV